MNGELHTGTALEADEPLEPLGPDSLTWIYAGDFRMLLLSVRAGLLQLMHPAFGAAVMQHSRFITAPWERLARSLTPVMTAIYGRSTAPHAALDVRDFHKGITGFDEHGQRYHALRPETFFWGHATIFENVVSTADLFDHSLTLDEKHRFYREALSWYRLYGVKTRALPHDWQAFCAYFDDICEHVLEPTPAARHLLDRVQGRIPTFLPGLPKALSRAITPPAFRLLWRITLGTLPDPVRTRLGYASQPSDAALLARVKTFVRRAWPLLPRRVRYLPLAYRAIREAERRGQ
jgi:uncharacterized protein (DUF2236 family)